MNSLLKPTILEHKNAVQHMETGFGFGVNCYTNYIGPPQSRYSAVNQTYALDTRGKNYKTMTRGFIPSYVVRVWPK